jgi:phosphoglycerate dehydrogenase-like enzyme
MKKTLLICDYKNYSKEDLAKLSNRFIVIKKHFKENQELLTHLKKFPNSIDILFITIGFVITDTIVKKFQKKLNIIFSPTTGTNHIKIINKKIKIITLLNIKKKIKNIQSTSELTWGLLLNLTRKIIPASKKNFLKKLNREKYIGNDLFGKTILIIGYGRIGKQLSKFSKAFGMKTKIFEILYNQSKKHLYNLLSMSDIVVLCINLKNKNKIFFDYRCFSKMKKNSYFINTSRGELVDEKALLYSLKNKKIGGAALDVLTNENRISSNSNHSLINYAKKNTNLIITPHVGGATIESFKMTRTQLINYFLNDKKNSVYLR